MTNTAVKYQEEVSHVNVAKIFLVDAQKSKKANGRTWTYMTAFSIDSIK